MAVPAAKSVTSFTSNLSPRPELLPLSCLPVSRITQPLHSSPRLLLCHLLPGPSNSHLIDFLLPVLPPFLQMTNRGFCPKTQTQSCYSLLINLLWLLIACGIKTSPNQVLTHLFSFTCCHLYPQAPWPSEALYCDLPPGLYVLQDQTSVP